MTKLTASLSPMTIGLDVGDRNTHYSVLDAARSVVDRGSMPTTKASIAKKLARFAPCLIVLEAGSQSPWLSRYLEALGFKTLVVDPRRVQLITKDPRKTDRRDAETLARLAAAMPEVLGAIRHRGEQAQADLSVIRVRDLLIETRSSMVLQVRGLAKAFGTRLPAASTPAFPKRVRHLVPEKLKPAVESAFEVLETLSQKIRELDDQLEQIAQDRYPDAAVVRQVRGVGPLTSLAFILTIEDASRFAKSRQVGSWVGLCPRSFASGDSVPQLPITKAGDATLRRLLVQCAQYILGPFGEDCDLRRFGQRLTARGGRAAKKRAVVAVARKLAILLHFLWRTGAVYDPLYNAKRLQAAQAV